MSTSRFWKLPLLGLASLALNSHLTATTTVTSSAGDSSSGTLSSAITDVNTGLTTSPIQIIEEVSPTLTTTPFSTISSSMTIESNVSGSSRTINGNNVSGGISISSGTTTFKPDIILENANIAATNATLTLKGHNNWDDAPSISLDHATLNFSYADTQSANQTFTGEIIVNGTASILVPNLKNSSGYYAYPTLVIKGQITEASPGTKVTLGDSGSITLNNISSTNNWTGGTVTKTSVSISNSASFPANSDITIESGILTFNLASSDTYTSNGTINGPGSLYVTRGTVNLSGNISDLSSLSLSTCTLNISGNLSNTQSEIVVLAGTILNISGNISGDPWIHLYGETTTTLSGDNTSYTGACTIDPGATLNISSATNIGITSSLGLSGGTLHTTGNVTFNSDQVGLNFSATFSADAETTLTLPVLKVEHYSSSPDLSLTLSGSGSFHIAEFAITPYSYYDLYTVSEKYFDLQCDVNGILSGSNGLTLLNTLDVGAIGTLSLSGTQTYTGPTDIRNSTTLLVNSSGSVGNTSDPISIASGGTLQINSDANVYCSTLTNYGTITGCGEITIADIGNSYGDLTCGCSPSPLSIIGNIILQPDSNLNIYVEPTGASALNVTGNVTINDNVTLNLNPIPGCYPAQTQFIVLNASGGLTGQFSQIILGTRLLTATSSYAADDLIITLDRSSLVSLGLTGNAKAVGTALDELINVNNARLCSLMPALFFLDDAGIADALNQMQPALFKGLTITQENNIVKVRDTLSLRIQKELDSVHCYSITEEQKCSSKTKPFHVWVDALGDSLSQDSTTFAASPQVGYHENTYGFATGVDYHFARYFYAGVLGAYTHSHMKWAENQGNGRVNSEYGGLYFSAVGDLFYGNASIIGSSNQFHEHRNINLSLEDFTASNKHNGKQLLSHIDTGVNLGWKWLTIRPFDFFDYIAQKENAFTEKGASGLNLSVEKSNAIMLRNELGINFATCFCIAKSQWILSPKISWVREVRIKGSHYTAEFAGTDVPFTVTGYFPDRSLVSPGVSLTGSMLNDLLVVSLYYNGEFKGGYSDHSYGGQVRFGF